MLLCHSNFLIEYFKLKLIESSFLRKFSLMESDVAGQRYTTWFLWREGVSAAEIHRRLTAVCGPNSPSRATVYNWIDAFKAGKTSTEDAPRSGRPVTASTLEKVNQIRDLVKSDPRVTISELSDQTGISFGSVQTILSEELGLSKLTCRWIPKLLTQEQLFTRVEVSRLLLERQTREGPGFLDRIVAGDEAWFFFHEPETKTMSKEWRPVGSPPPLKPRETISAAKRMAIVFWDNIGILLIDWVPHGATINSQYYITVLENLRESIKENRRGKLTRGCCFCTTTPARTRVMKLQLLYSDWGLKYYSTLPIRQTSPRAIIICSQK